MGQYYIVFQFCGHVCIMRTCASRMLFCWMAGFWNHWFNRIMINILGRCCFEHTSGQHSDVQQQREKQRALRTSFAYNYIWCFCFAVVVAFLPLKRAQIIAHFLAFSEIKNFCVEWVRQIVADDQIRELTHNCSCLLYIGWRDEGRVGDAQCFLGELRNTQDQKYYGMRRILSFS